MLQRGGIRRPGLGATAKRDFCCASVKGERFALDALAGAGLLFAARYSGGSSSAGVVLARRRDSCRQSHFSPLSIRRLWHETNCAFYLASLMVSFGSGCCCCKGLFGSSYATAPPPCVPGPDRFIPRRRRPTTRRPPSLPLPCKRRSLRNLAALARARNKRLGSWHQVCSLAERRGVRSVGTRTDTIAPELKSDGNFANEAQACGI